MPTKYYINNATGRRVEDVEGTKTLVELNKMYSLDFEDVTIQEEARILREKEDRAVTDLENAGINEVEDIISARQRKIALDELVAEGVIEVTDGKAKKKNKLM